MPLLGLSIPLQPEAPGLAWLPTPTGKRCWCSSRGRWAPRGTPYAQVNSGTWILSPIRVSRAFTGHISHIQVVGTFFFWKPVLCLKAFLGAGCGSCSWSRWICILQLLFFFFNYFHQKECFYGAARSVHPLSTSGFGGLFFFETEFDACL